MMSPRPHSRDRAGGSAIEFALLLPVFVLILGFIIDYGLFFHVRAAATSVVWQACRAGAAVAEDDSPTPEETAEARIDSAVLAQPLFGCDDGDCAVTVTTSGTSPDTVLQCTLHVDYGGFTGTVIMPDGVKVSASTTLEQQS